MSIRPNSRSKCEYIRPLFGLLQKQCSHRPKRTYSHRLAQYTHRPTHTILRTHLNTKQHKPTQTHTHRPTDTRAHLHPRARAHTHTHTHTDTRTRLNSGQFFYFL